MKFAAFAFTLLAASFAAANSIDYSTGNFVSGTVKGSLTTHLVVHEVGTTATIDISTGHLMPFTVGCPTGDKCFDFTGGKVTVIQNGHSIFHDSLVGGLTLTSKGVGSINATMTNETGVFAGAVVSTFDYNAGVISAGSANVSYNTTVPEPTTLLLFGSGLIGIVAKYRRQFV